MIIAQWSFRKSMMNSLNTAIILAAGRGTRLRPLTDTVPKVLIEIGGRPLLEKTVGEVVGSGIENVVFVVGYLGNRIEEYFGDGEKWGANFTYVRQDILNGTGGAVLLAEKYVDGDFLVIFGDSFFGEDAVAVMKQAAWQNAIGVVKVADPRRYGVVELTESGGIKSIVEKPERPKSDLAIAGIYKFHPDIWGPLHALTPSQRGELEIPDAVRKLVSLGRSVGTVELKSMTDIGTHEDLERIRQTIVAPFRSA
jgi:glucose-1-phosphate thymidylyltransferase